MFLTTASRICLQGNQLPELRPGRLPWRTLGLADLRDADGERLWYAVSPNFRDYASQVLINDATAGTLSVSGASNLNDVVAIVFAPGAPVGAQSRDGAANQNNVVNYRKALTRPAERLSSASLQTPT